jgi:hypothetical protein
MKTTFILGDILDIIFVCFFVGFYVIGFLFICFVVPIINRRYFAQLKKEMEEDEKNKRIS